jgi:hypothetical protein
MIPWKPLSSAPRTRGEHHLDWRLKGRDESISDGGLQVTAGDVEARIDVYLLCVTWTTSGKPAAWVEWACGLVESAGDVMA